MGRWFVLFLSTVGFVGTIPQALPFRKWKGSGLLGTMVGWALLWVLPSDCGFWAWTLGLTILAVAVSHDAEKWLTHDDPQIVIDEVVGMWVASLGLSRSMVPLATAFIAFRFFDVLKGPWGNAAARLPGGWGIVADDVVAGILANVVTRFLLEP